jgi:hypothetical protein
MVCATVRSNRSPARCPHASLIALRPSTSTKDHHERLPGAVRSIERRPHRGEPDAPALDPGELVDALVRHPLGGAQPVSGGVSTVLGGQRSIAGGSLPLLDHPSQALSRDPPVLAGLEPAANPEGPQTSSAPSVRAAWA